MAQIMVTSSELRKKAEELRNLNSQFNSKVEELSNDELNMASKWEGEARDAFHNAFNMDKVKWSDFYAAINQYATALETIAAEYERKEAENVVIASN